MKTSTLIPFFMSALLSLSSSGAQASYCAAIRGNGELMPAHWGAMSSLVESEGLPSAMSGGSSASITMFLLESLSLNPVAQNNSEKALLIKSFQGYLESLSQTPEGKAAQSILTDKNAFQSVIATSPKLQEALANRAGQALIAKHLHDLQTLMASEDLKHLINPDFVLYVQRTLAMAKKQVPSLQPIVNYRTGQINQAFKNFGKFDAKTDATLFLRPGLINFTGLAKIIGKMGDFYAGYDNDGAAGKQNHQNLRSFLETCTPESKDLSWAELNQKRPACRELLDRAIVMYHKTHDADKSRINELIGSYIPSFATTSVLTGKAVNQFARLYAEYQTTSDPAFGKLTVQSEDLRFGYWGATKDLALVETQFKTAKEYADDAKSQKFHSLGQAPWLDILSTSPAEPGLSRIVALSRQELSAGGWSDLHPVMVLKAHGCENIIYLTRKGGESPFAKDVFQRLQNADEKTMDQYYGTENLQSSMMRSQANATKIKCTDWNHFNVKTDINGLVEDAMRAPLLDPPYCK